MKKSKKQTEKSQTVKPKPIVSKVFNKAHMLELLYAPRLEKTALAYWNGKTFEIKSEHENYVPVKAGNNLIKHGVLKLPSYVEDYDDLDELKSEIQSFIHRYVDLPSDFETVAVHYVLLTWVYDRFRELPYLRLIGDFGTGKTRFLQIVGAICYKPIFASGASTVSPIFHSLDSFRGTLVLDEADFRFSDARSEIVKILNNGNAKGFPVLRCEGNSKGQYNPRAFHVFGPKIIATRHHYTDPALESRLITSAAKAGSIRQDIPINLPDSYEQEAESLRNKLLMFRFLYWQDIDPDMVIGCAINVNRIAQIFRPLLALACDNDAKAAILSYAKKSQSFLKSFRSHSFEEQVLSVIFELMNKKAKLSVKAITSSYQARFGGQHINPVTPKWIGGIIRSKLHLNTTKRQGVYVISETEISKLKALLERYDIHTNSTVADKTTP